MKTPFLLFAVFTFLLTLPADAQNKTIVNAMNSEISDNLDLRVVASVFGDARNLQDFERRLNDPKLQISNLDLNYDGQVDYLRVIETVEKRTHIIIIQSVLNRDLYQDVATIELEKTRSNKVHIQVVGNSYFYGPNYIYEPVYCYTPIIYTDFWMSNYRPYYSNWYWNYYPSYYYAWNTYPTFRYRYNVNICLNNYDYNNYNYVQHRRSSYSSSVYKNYHSNGYERLYPEQSFSRRNTAVSNRYELDQVRNYRNTSVKNTVGYSPNRAETPKENSTQRIDTRRDYSQNRVETPRENNVQRIETRSDYSQNRVETPRQASPPRDYTQTRVETPRENNTPRIDTRRDYSQNRVETPRHVASQKDYSQNRVESPRENNTQRIETRREYSQNRAETPRRAAPQRSEAAKENTNSRNSSADGSSGYSRNGNRRA